LSLLPAELDCQEFREAWDEWIADRRDRRLPRYTARAERMQLRRLEEMGAAGAVEAIKWSITQGYKGIWPAPASAGRAATASRTPSAWEMQKKLDLVEQRLRELRSRSPGEHCDLRQFLSAEEIEEYGELLSKRKSIRTQLIA
jgi:hypothetical protein